MLYTCKTIAVVTYIYSILEFVTLVPTKLLSTKRLSILSDAVCNSTRN
jgi:hypothetical protein